jgi:predicted permease
LVINGQFANRSSLRYGCDNIITQVIIMLDLIQIFFDNIAPILILTSIGYLLGKNFKIDTPTISTLLFYVLSPALVFTSLYNSKIGGDEILSLFTSVILLVLTMLLISRIVSHLQGVNPQQKANVTLSAIGLNAGNYGLSLIGFAFSAEVLSRASIIFVATSMLTYTLSVYIASMGNYSPRESFQSILKAPAIYAVISAFALQLLQIDLPLVLSRSFETLSKATIPMMVLLLGFQLSQYKPTPHALNLLATGTILRLIVSPIIALVIASILNLTGDARTAFIMQASMPTAVVTLVLSTQFELDRDLALGFIFTTTLLSPITLSILIAVLK